MRPRTLPCRARPLSRDNTLATVLFGGRHGLDAWPSRARATSTRRNGRSCSRAPPRPGCARLEGRPARSPAHRREKDHDPLIPRRLPVGRRDRGPPGRGQQREQRLLAPRAGFPGVHGPQRRRERQLPPLPRGHGAPRRVGPRHLPLQPGMVAHRTGTRPVLPRRARALPTHDRHGAGARTHAVRHHPPLHAPHVVRGGRRMAGRRLRRGVRALRSSRPAASSRTSPTSAPSTSPTSSR